MAKPAKQKKPAARKPTKKPAAKKPAAKPTKKAAPPKRPAPAKFGARADFGASIDGYLARQAPPQRAILDAIRALIHEAAPEAIAALKWGNPFFSIGAGFMCAMSSHKTHVNLILPGPPGTYADPGGHLEGEGKTGKHLALRSLDELPRDAVRGWLATAASRARAGVPMGK